MHSREESRLRKLFTGEKRGKEFDPFAEEYVKTVGEKHYLSRAERRGEKKILLRKFRIKEKSATYYKKKKISTCKRGGRGETP